MSLSPVCLFKEVEIPSIKTAKKRLFVEDDSNKENISRSNSLTESYYDGLSVLFDSLMLPEIDLPIKNATPKKIAKLKEIIESRNIDSPIGRMGEKDLKGAYEEIESLSDSPNKKSRASQIHLISKKLWEKLAKARPDSYEFHKDVSEKLENEAADWVHGLLGALKRYYKGCVYLLDERPINYIIDIEHITRFVSESEIQTVQNNGFHFCPADHPLRSCLTERRTNPRTGVFGAWFNFNPNQELKFSTFFPESMTKEEVIKAIQNSKEMVRDGNRSLRRVENLDFVIEVYHKGPLRIKTAFPLFFCETYLPASRFQIMEGLSLSSEDILRKLEKLTQDYLEYKTDFNPLKYQEKDVCFIDIAPTLSAWGIKEGVFFKFSREILANCNRFDEL